MENNTTNQSQFPPYSPMAYFGGNLLLGGLSYVMLRQYKRFFIYFGILIVSAFIPLASYVVLFGSAYDAYVVSKKMKENKIPIPGYSRGLTIAAIAVWVLLLALFIGSIVLYRRAVY